MDEEVQVDTTNIRFDELLEAINDIPSQIEFDVTPLTDSIEELQRDISNIEDTSSSISDLTSTVEDISSNVEDLKYDVSAILDKLGAGEGQQEYNTLESKLDSFNIKLNAIIAHLGIPIV